MIDIRIRLAIAGCALLLGEGCAGGPAARAPQAALVALRPLGNELIGLIKASALSAIVTLLDLMGQTRFVFAKTFDFSVYLYAALIYLAMTEAIRRVWNVLERRLSRHLALPAHLTPVDTSRTPAMPAAALGGSVSVH